MTTLREAAQQALDALEGKRYTACGWRSDCDKAITALCAALAEPVQEPIRWDASAPLVVHPHPAFQTAQRKPLADGDNLSPTGCDYCNHPLYAAIKCRSCGRVTG